MSAHLREEMVARPVGSGRSRPSSGTDVPRSDFADERRALQAGEAFDLGGVTRYGFRLVMAGAALFFHV